MISFELNTHKLRNRTQKGSEMCLWEGMKEKWQHQVSNTGLLIKLMLPPLDHNYLWLLTLTSMERGSCFHCMRKDPELIPKMQELVIMISFSLKRAFRKKWTEREKLDPLLIAPQDSVHFSVPVLQFTNIPGIVGDPLGFLLRLQPGMAGSKLTSHQHPWLGMGRFLDVVPLTCHLYGRPSIFFSLSKWLFY